MPIYIRYSDEDKIKEIELLSFEVALPPQVEGPNVIEVEVSGEDISDWVELFNGLVRPPKGKKIIWQGDVARLMWQFLLDRQE